MIIIINYHFLPLLLIIIIIFIIGLNSNGHHVSGSFQKVKIQSKGIARRQACTQIAITAAVLHPDSFHGDQVCDGEWFFKDFICVTQYQ